MWSSVFCWLNEFLLNNESEDELWTFFLLLSGVAFFLYGCVFGTSSSTLSRLKRAGALCSKKKKINARLMVMCWYSPFFVTLPPFIYVQKYKCAHINRFNLNACRSGYYFFLYSSKVFSFDSYKSVQMKHMHVNETF